VGLYDLTSCPDLGWGPYTGGRGSYGDAGLVLWDIPPQYALHSRAHSLPGRPPSPSLYPITSCPTSHSETPDDIAVTALSTPDIIPSPYHSYSQYSDRSTPYSFPSTPYTFPNSPCTTLPDYYSPYALPTATTLPNTPYTLPGTPYPKSASKTIPRTSYTVPNTPYALPGTPYPHRYKRFSSYSSSHILVSPYKLKPNFNLPNTPYRCSNDIFTSPEKNITIPDTISHPLIANDINESLTNDESIIVPPASFSSPPITTTSSSKSFFTTSVTLPILHNLHQQAQYLEAHHQAEAGMLSF